MMSQVVNTETLSSVENRHLDASQQQSSSYVPTTTSETVSWTMHKVDYSSKENGVYSNPTYQYEQYSLPPPPQLPSGRGAQDSLTSASAAGGSSSSGTANVAQEYSAYVAYPSSSNPYGYSSTGYSNYYSSYQHQSNHSYSQHVGAYQNTGAPYQPISSFQNTGSYAGSTTYSSTYYSPADYQSTGGYQGSSYGNSTNLWNNGNYSNYSSHQYTSYTPDGTGAYSAGMAAPASLQYQQHYKQWADYYSQTEVSCAPGTENLSVASTSNENCPVPGVTVNHAAPNNQPQPTYAPYNPSWRPEPSSSNVPPAQPATVISGAHDGGYWQPAAQTFQNHHPSTIQPNFQKPLDLKTYDNFQDQHKIASSEVSNLQYPPTQQVQQNNQPTLQTTSVDLQRMNKLQIPTNPRIASNFTLGLSKTDKDSSTSSAPAKPAYISVSMPKSDEKVLSNEAASSIFKPGTFPKSLRGYVERALARCKDDTQMAACQASLKEIITKATDDGTLFTRNWDIEPLFPIPGEDVINRDSQSSLDDSSSFKYKRSPSKRSKSRWEPLPEELAGKLVSARNDASTYSGWLHVNEKDQKLAMENIEFKDDAWRNSKFSSPMPTMIIKASQRTFKRQRIADGFDGTADGDGSSDSDKEQSLTAYYSGAVALSDSPEERKRRENRSKRFERVQGHRMEHNNIRLKNAGPGNLYARRATALVLSKNFEDGGNRAVEDIDWDALTVKGTCQEIEKRYLRLTSAPDPSTVRPEEVLEKALLMVQNSQKNYLYKCDQLKSIRQDLTVQRIHNQLTVKVYETHARLALELGDLPEYNQCQSQLRTLYAEGVDGCHMEFAAYNLLYVLLHTNNYKELLSSMSRLSDEAKHDDAVRHALAVRTAVTLGNYVTYFRLYKTAPNLNTYLMDLYVEKMRFKAITCMCRSYRPTIPVSYISQALGFSRIMAAKEGIDEKEMDALEECIEWLKAHGASVIADNNGDMLLDTKASASSLYVPEPEDAVAHGDANLALNDFFARTPL